MKNNFITDDINYILESDKCVFFPKYIINYSQHHIILAFHKTTKTWQANAYTTFQTFDDAKRYFNISEQDALILRLRYG